MPRPPIQTEGPFSRPWPRAGKWWLLGAVLALFALCGSVAFTLGVLVRLKGIA